MCLLMWFSLIHHFLTIRKKMLKIFKDVSKAELEAVFLTEKEIEEGE